MTTKTVQQIVEGAKRRESTLRVCLRGDLAAQYEAAEAELADLTQGAGWQSTSLADENPTTALAERIQAIRAEMLDETVTFTFRALKRRAWEDLLKAHRRDDGGLNVDTLAIPLVAACAIDPVMSESDVEDVFDVVNEGQRDALFSAAYGVNMEATEVPFSERASAVMRARDSK